MWAAAAAAAAGLNPWKKGRQLRAMAMDFTVPGDDQRPRVGGCIAHGDPPASRVEGGMASSCSRGPGTQTGGSASMRACSLSNTIWAIDLLGRQHYNDEKVRRGERRHGNLVI
jgi:hypothetical protein